MSEAADPGTVPTSVDATTGKEIKITTFVDLIKLLRQGDTEESLNALLSDIVSRVNKDGITCTLSFSLTIDRYEKKIIIADKWAAKGKAEFGKSEKDETLFKTAGYGQLTPVELPSVTT